MRKFTEEEIPVDILRMHVNRSRKFSLNTLVNGHSQIGKTTWIDYMANRIIQCRQGKLYLDDPRITWHEWNAKKFTATNAYDFVELWDKYDNAVLTLAEAGESLNYLEWYSIMAKVFASTTRTQGLKRNICFLDTVMSTDIQKHNKENIDFRIWVFKRIDPLRIAATKNYWVEINYAKDKWRLRWLPNWEITYTNRFLIIAKEYTNWVAGGFKKDIANKNKRLVGMLPSLKEEELMQEIKETKRWNEEHLKNPIKVDGDI
jgi:hypothetical protein